MRSDEARAEAAAETEGSSAAIPMDADLVREDVERRAAHPA
jgi:hypothetical protein